MNIAEPVFPTPVGMVRLIFPSMPAINCFPHARGDGPPAAAGEISTGPFSPRPWGWSEARQMACYVEAVFPTPVGMVRDFSPSPCRNGRFPHARGDGPSTGSRIRSAITFSPRPWGWSDSPVTTQSVYRVFPTPVGMVRVFDSCFQLYGSFPHARGDGPYVLESSKQSFKFSPRPWGWSSNTEKNIVNNTVFPTPVGMVRLINFPLLQCNCFPHARGDGPR